jgi:fumarylacetoacetase
MPDLDQTHDPNRASWVVSANDDSEFPIQNLPFGIFSPPGQVPRAGVAIGDRILDLSAAAACGVFSSDAQRAAEACAGGSLNRFLALGAEPRRSLRTRLSEVLTAGSSKQAQVEPCLHAATDCTLHLPVSIGDYTDFYVGIHHATRIGKLFRPDNPLLPNYKFVPIGYHGRASSIVPSGTPVRRPTGQAKAPDTTQPTVGPSRQLDFELELGLWIGAGNALGHPIDIAEAAEHVGGFCLLNDWSARDIQAWEYQPLGPFLGKSFATTVSTWVVTPEALAPFRIAQPARPAGDPSLLPYLFNEADQQAGALHLELEVLLLTPGLRATSSPPHRIALSDAQYMYWTGAQMITHHTSNGCNLRPGDLLGTGTLSGPDTTASGSLIELTSGGRDPLVLPSGEQRRFLEDGDEIILRARGTREDFTSIGFGECRAVVVSA